MASSPGGSLEIDVNVLKLLSSKYVTATAYLQLSAWARYYRIECRLPSGLSKSYFLKISTGYHGREALKGEFISTSDIYAVVPDLTNNPIGWGSFRDAVDTHFYLCEFRNLSHDAPPKIEPFCERLAALHKHSISPNGKFGYRVVTYNGNMPKDNTWADTWEEFFLHGFKHVVKLNLLAGGPSEIQDLLPVFYEKVIPRLLRPLETGDRFVKPSLVHGDLWFGNAAMDLARDRPVVFDPCCFYGHNEYELGNWRQARNNFTQEYFDAYHSHYPISHPEEDYDDRNTLYAIRFNLHAATLFPHAPSFRASVVDEMKRLIKKYPGGFTDWVEH